MSELDARSALAFRMRVLNRTRERIGVVCLFACGIVKAESFFVFANVRRYCFCCIIRGAYVVYAFALWAVSICDMYNGVGLKTTRGSGTSGYVQRNASQVRRSRGGGAAWGGGKDPWKTGEASDKVEKRAPLPRKGIHPDILDHERKRKIEVRVLEAGEEWEEEGLSAKEVEKRCDRLRKRLIADGGHISAFAKKKSAPPPSRREVERIERELHSTRATQRRWSPRREASSRGRLDDRSHRRERGREYPPVRSSRHDYDRRGRGGRRRSRDSRSRSRSRSPDRWRREGESDRRRGRR